MWVPSMIMWLHKLLCRKGGWLRGIWHQFWIWSVFIAHNHILFFTLSFLLCQQKVLDDISLVSSTEDVTETDAPRERSNIVLFVLCGLVVTFGAVGVWKMRLKKGKPLLGHTEIEQDRGTRHKMDSTLTTTPNISSGSVMHRKLKSSVWYGYYLD